MSDLVTARSMSLPLILPRPVRRLKPHEIGTMLIRILPIGIPP